MGGAVVWIWPCRWFDWMLGATTRDKDMKVTFIFLNNIICIYTYVPLVSSHKYRSVNENHRVFRKPPLLGPPLSCANRWRSSPPWGWTPARSSPTALTQTSTRSSLSIYLSISISLSIYIYIYIYTCLYNCMYTHVCTYTYIYIHTYILLLLLLVVVLLHIHIHICIYIYTHNGTNNNHNSYMYIWSHIFQSACCEWCVCMWAYAQTLVET